MHNLLLTGIYKGSGVRMVLLNLKTFVRMQNQAFVTIYTFKMKSTESFIHEAPELNDTIFCRADI